MTLQHPTRRNMIALTLAAPLALRMQPARATPEAMQSAITGWSGGASITEGRVTLEIPMLVANGNAVPLKVSAESPMTEEDYVAEIAVFNEANPLPDIVRFHFTPRSGRASAETRIRLSGTQYVHAIARMNDGTYWSAATNVIVTAPACAES